MPTILRYAGQKRANPNARADNNLKLPLDVMAVSAEDSLSFTTAGTTAVTAFTYDGVVYNIDSFNANDSINLQAAIYAILRTKEVNPILNLGYSGGNITLQHVGGGTISGLTVGGTSRATTRKTTISTICTTVFTKVFTGAITPLVVNGTSTAVSGTYAYSGNSSTDATTAASLKSALDTAIGTNGAAVTCTVQIDDVKKGYAIKFYGATSLLVKLAGSFGVQQDIQEKFV